MRKKTYKKLVAFGAASMLALQPIATIPGVGGIVAFGSVHDSTISVALGDDAKGVFVQAGTNGINPTRNGEGHIIVPKGGTVQSPGYKGIVQPPEGTIVLTSNKTIGEVVLGAGTIVTRNNMTMVLTGAVAIPGKDGKLGTPDDIIVVPNPANKALPQFHPDGSVWVSPEATILKDKGATRVTAQNIGYITADGRYFAKDNTIVNVGGGSGTTTDDGVVPPTDGGAVVPPTGGGALPPVTGNSVRISVGGRYSITIYPGSDGKRPVKNSLGDYIVPLGGWVTRVDSSDAKPPRGSVVIGQDRTSASNEKFVTGMIVTPGKTVIDLGGSAHVVGKDGLYGTLDDVTVIPRISDGKTPSILADGTVLVPSGGMVVLRGKEEKYLFPRFDIMVTPSGLMFTDAGELVGVDGEIIDSEIRPPILGETEVIPPTTGETEVKPPTGGTVKPPFVKPNDKPVIVKPSVGTIPPKGGSSGGGGGGGGGGGSSKGSKVKAGAGVKTNVSNTASFAIGSDGEWNNLDPANPKWVFKLKNGELLKDSWALIRSDKESYYRFDKDGNMQIGWYQDDKNAYYLDEVSGAMVTGWKEIGGKWYFFNNAVSKDEAEAAKQKPLGLMYRNERTPDGYEVDADGVYIVK